MSYAVLEKKLKTLPEQSFSEVDEFFDYMLYKFGRKKDEKIKSDTKEGMKSLNSLNEILPQNITHDQAKEERLYQHRIETATSLFGILSSDITLEESKKERLSKI